MAEYSARQYLQARPFPVLYQGGAEVGRSHGPDVISGSGCRGRQDVQGVSLTITTTHV